ncbi:MAG: hypothetical protein Q7U66_06180 [Methylobacter sp.]|nr:hypothetical protein [Methylobacter sp.]
MTLLPAGVDIPLMVSFSKKTTWCVHHIVAWEVSGKSAEPIFYPEVPKGNTLFLEESAIITNVKTGDRYAGRRQVENHEAN